MFNISQKDGDLMDLIDEAVYVKNIHNVYIARIYSYIKPMHSYYFMSICLFLCN